MKTIYKYPIEITDSQVIKMPINAEMIHAGLDPQGANAHVDLPDTAAQDSDSKSNSPAVSG